MQTNSTITPQQEQIIDHAIVEHSWLLIMEAVERRDLDLLISLADRATELRRALWWNNVRLLRVELSEGLDLIQGNHKEEWLLRKALNAMESAHGR